MLGKTGTWAIAPKSTSKTTLQITPMTTENTAVIGAKGRVPQLDAVRGVAILIVMVHNISLKYPVLGSEVWAKDGLHEMHESGWCVGETEWQNKKFIMTITSTKCSLVNIVIVNSNLVISRS